MRLLLPSLTLAVALACAGCAEPPIDDGSAALLVWTRAQGGPVTTTFEAVPDLPVPALRSAPMSPAAAEALWAYLRGRRLDVHPVILLTHIPVPFQRTPSAAKHLADARAYARQDASIYYDAERRWHRRYVDCDRAALEGRPSPTPEFDCTEECDADRVMCLSRVVAEYGTATDSADDLVLRAVSMLEKQPLVSTDRLVKTEAEVWVVGTPPWLVPAVFAFRPSEPPTDDVLAIVLRDDLARYGASVRAMTPLNLEIVVARPPESAAAALPLAREQRLLLDGRDISRDDIMSLASKTRALVGRRAWRWWWE